MVDQGNRAAAYGSLRSVLRALDEEGETAPMPAYDRPDWHYPEITPGTAVVSHPGPGSEDEDGPRSRFAIARGHVGSSTRKALAAMTFAGPVAVLLLVVALFILPPPDGQSARTAFDDLRLVTESQADPVSSAEIIHVDETELTESSGPERGVAGFAELARKALAATELTRIEAPQPNTSQN